MWYSYNKALFQQYKKNNFSILNFDDDEEVLDEKMLGAAAEMGLANKNEDEKFYTAELKHNSGAGGLSLPWKVSRLYKKLKKHQFYQFLIKLFFSLSVSFFVFFVF